MRILSFLLYFVSRNCSDGAAALQRKPKNGVIREIVAAATNAQNWTRKYTDERAGASHRLHTSLPSFLFLFLNSVPANVSERVVSSRRRNEGTTANVL